MSTKLNGTQHHTCADIFQETKQFVFFSTSTVHTSRDSLVLPLSHRFQWVELLLTSSDFGDLYYCHLSSYNESQLFMAIMYVGHRLSCANKSARNEIVYAHIACVSTACERGKAIKICDFGKLNTVLFLMWLERLRQVVCRQMKDYVYKLLGH